MEAVAKLRNVRMSPRKMRLVADMIRGQKVSKALDMLKFERKIGASYMSKLLLSAVANWEAKNEDTSEIGNLIVSRVFVDGGKMLKRIQPAPQGRAHRILKCSNHVTLVVDVPKEGATSLSSMTEKILNEAATQVEDAASKLESDQNSKNN
ncbi:50S ribosomal protein L22 [Hugenholtzia roseola]|uniref:50S ribosomal protein L22 n=1 Tax=Hugenholtzia roseola TaxID=1002 RepID=UPI0004797CCE|nr:50S ribosomal protein L22 [Hugenholtzia roseola]